MEKISKINIIFIHLIIFIFQQLKCDEFLNRKDTYQNIQLIKENGGLSLLIYDKKIFDEFSIINEEESKVDIQILDEPFEFSYSSPFYQYSQYDDFYNYFFYVSIYENSKYYLKLIFFDRNSDSERIFKQFNIQNVSIVPSFEVFYASETIHFVFFGNNLYKYQIDFTLKEKKNNTAKQLLINNVYLEKSININNLYNRNYSQSLINFNDSLLMISYIYPKTSEIL